MLAGIDQAASTIRRDRLSADIRTLPWSGFVSPSTKLRVVDFTALFGPSRQTASPESNSRSGPETARTAPWVFVAAIAEIADIEPITGPQNSAIPLLSTADQRHCFRSIVCLRQWIKINIRTRQAKLNLQVFTSPGRRTHRPSSPEHHLPSFARFFGNKPHRVPPVRQARYFSH